MVPMLKESIKQWIKNKYIELNLMLQKQQDKIAR